MSDPDTERTAVKTYVPRYQKEAWAERAAELGMSQSEFVRTMVQAGVRDLGLDDEDSDPTPTAGSDAGDADEDLHARVVAELRERDVAPWDALVDALAGDFEERLEAALDRLTEAGTVAYRPREGGYVLREDQ